ncbi:uncharacterized protein LOC129751634 [Uranotaenia lowii]|uniref:uncharacterized protein LOC129751634 n=1 Tax=Uranotaenia lowii TaxID=190385 RepID=UPI00247A44E8|nr:uncharacterized protein LOC129751634 [Uranotaenia lowii]
MDVFRVAGGLLLGVFVLGISSADRKQFSCEETSRFKVTNICVINGVKLSENSVLPDGDFPDVAFLELRNPEILDFEVQLFEKTSTNTTELTLRRGQVRSINFWSPSLKVLRIVETGLSSFEVLGEPNNVLRQLVIRSRDYSNWSVGMFWLSALEIIDIAYCNFTYINLDWFGGFQKLKVLDVSKNHIHSLQSGPFLTLNSLEELYVWGNRLEYIWRFPDVFPKLERIGLSENRWLCDWVSLARESLMVLNIISMGSDYNCKPGWALNGGLCCRRTGEWKLSGDGSNENRVHVDLYITETGNSSRNDSVVGAKMGDMVIFLDKPVNATT